MPLKLAGNNIDTGTDEDLHQSFPLCVFRHDDNIHNSATTSGHTRTLPQASISCSHINNNEPQLFRKIRMMNVFN